MVSLAKFETALTKYGLDRAKSFASEKAREELQARARVQWERLKTSIKDEYHLERTLDWLLRSKLDTWPTENDWRRALSESVVKKAEVKTLPVMAETNQLALHAMYEAVREAKSFNVKGWRYLCSVYGDELMMRSYETWVESGGTKDLIGKRAREAVTGALNLGGTP